MITSLRSLTCFLFLLFSTYSLYAQPSTYASIPYTTGFESGLGANWFTQASAPSGRIQIWPYIPWGSNDTAFPHTGLMHLGLDNAPPGGTNVQTEAWMGLNLAGASGLRFEFWWQEWNEETSPQDGVYLSNNGGTTFVKAINLNGASVTDLTWQFLSYNLDSMVASHGLTYTSNFVIKFQQYDNYYFAGGNDGILLDDIAVYSPCGQAPNLTCPAPITMNAGAGICTATASWPALSATDPCSGNPPAITQLAGLPSGSSFPSGVTTNTYRAQGAGGADTCSFTVTVVDNQAPTAVCQNATVQLTSPGMTTLNPNDFDGGCADNCTITLSVTPAQVSCTNLGTTTVVLTVNDGTQTSTCTATAQVVDTSGAAQIPVNLGNNPSGCEGTITLDAGSGLSSYSWSNGATTQTIMPATSGPYSVTVTNANGCSGTGSTQVTVLQAGSPNLQVAGGGNPVLCQGDTLMLQADPGFSNYAWSTGASTSDIQVTAGGVYTITVTASNGCQANQTLTVTSINAPGPVSTITPSGTVTSCDGAPITLAGPASLSAYAWSDGSSGSTVLATPGTYTLTVTDANGCWDVSDPVTVQSVATVQPVISVNGDSLCSTAASSYQWFLNGNPVPGGTTACIEASLAGGVYVLQTTDANGCTGTDSIVVISLSPNMTSGGSCVAYPNPFHQSVKFDLRSNSTGLGQLEVYSITGVRIATVLEANFSAGETITVDFTPDNLPAGMYLYRFIMDGQVQAQGKLVYRPQ